MATKADEIRQKAAAVIATKQAEEDKKLAAIKKEQDEWESAKPKRVQDEYAKILIELNKRAEDGENIWEVAILEEDVLDLLGKDGFRILDIGTWPVSGMEAYKRVVLG